MSNLKSIVFFAVLLPLMVGSLTLASPPPESPVSRTVGRWRLPEDTLETPVFYMLVGVEGKGLYPAVIIWGDGRIIWLRDYPNLVDETSIIYPSLSLDPELYVTEIIGGPYREAVLPVSSISQKIDSLRQAACFTDIGSGPRFSLQTSRDLTLTVVDNNQKITFSGLLDIIESSGERVLLETGTKRLSEPAEKDELLALESVEFLRFRHVYNMVRTTFDDLVREAATQEQIIDRPQILFKDRIYSQAPPTSSTPIPTPTGS